MLEFDDPPALPASSADGAEDNVPVEDPEETRRTIRAALTKQERMFYLRWCTARHHRVGRAPIGAKFMQIFEIALQCAPFFRKFLRDCRQ